MTPQPPPLATSIRFVLFIVLVIVVASVLIRWLDWWGAAISVAFSIFGGYYLAVWEGRHADEVP